MTEEADAVHLARFILRHFDIESDELTPRVQEIIRRVLDPEEMAEINGIRDMFGRWK